MSDQDEASAPSAGGWRVEQAFELLNGLNALTRTVSMGITADGDFDGVEVAWTDGERRFGPSAIAAGVGALLAVVEVTAAEWGLPLDLMGQEEQRRRHYVDRRFLDNDGGVKEGAGVLETLAAATYGVAATIAARGELDQVEVPGMDDDEVGGEEWLAGTLAGVRAAVREAAQWWGLPLDVLRQAEAEKRAYLRAAWGHEAK